MFIFRKYVGRRMFVVYNLNIWPFLFYDLKLKYINTCCLNIKFN